MGCAASTDRAERRRRGRALGHSEASTTGLLAARQQGQNHPESVAAAAGRRRGCKVAPEPKEQQEEEQPAPEPAMPGSPSFRGVSGAEDERSHGTKRRKESQGY
uniref:Uncharacterized protein n=1 Tax=Arundo donax TaxID=35708 RepID=A0A0A9D3E2_ARUDO